MTHLLDTHADDTRIQQWGGAPMLWRTERG